MFTGKNPIIISTIITLPGFHIGCGSRKSLGVLFGCMFASRTVGFADIFIHKLLMLLSYPCLLIVLSEFPICFAIPFWVNLGSLIYITINFNIIFCLYRRRIEFEFKFSYLPAESIVKLEADFYK